MLDNPGWRQTPEWVRTSCFACRKPIGPDQRVYAPELTDPYSVYCTDCGPKAEEAVRKLRAGERQPYALEPYPIISATSLRPVI